MSRGEIRLCRFDAPDKERPVLVLTRDPALRFLTRVTVAPITSVVRGVPSEVRIGIDDGMKADCAINLYNLVTVSKDRIGRRVASLSADRMRDVCHTLAYALGCLG